MLRCIKYATAIIAAIVAGVLDQECNAQECVEQWYPLSSGGENGVSGGEVSALTVHYGDLVVGGAFQTACGQTVNSIARWDGASWHSMASGGQTGLGEDSPFVADVRALTVYNGDLIAGGYFTTAGGQVVNGIARWDGSSWHPLSSGGQTGIGTGGVLALTVYNGELIAGGIFTTAGGQIVNSIARWNGSSWQPLASGGQSGVNNAVFALTEYNGELIAAGNFGSAGGVSVPRIARWNGSQWQPLLGVSGVSGDVFALAVYNGNLIVGGQFTTANGQTVNNIARWNGSSFHPLVSGGQIGVSYPGGSTWVFALAAYNGSLFVSGQIGTAGGQTVNGIARWDGTAWHPLVSGGQVGIDNGAEALMSYAGDLIVGASTDRTNGIAEWDGCTLWQPPGQTDPPVTPPYDPQPPPEPEQNKLIVVTHGFNTTTATFNDFWQPLANEIVSRVGGDWQVMAYDWTADSGNLNFIGGEFGPDYALSMAIPHGNFLALQIGENYQHVHLIAHSAGSALIAAAAHRIKQISPQTTVHTSYLDAFAGTFILGGVGDYQDAYGGPSDWSDHYFSQERPIGWILDCGFNPPPTGALTQLHLENSYNVDVSLFDPGFDLTCFSNHTWPRCFYAYTVDDGTFSECEAPTVPTNPFGFPLSYENIGGDVQSWINSINLQYPKGHMYPPPGALAGDGGEADNLVFRTRLDAPLNLVGTPYVVSSEAAIQIAENGFAATTQPKGSPEPAPAWVNVEVTTTTAINMIRFNLQFGSTLPAAGLVAVYVNGVKRGVVDEAYAAAGPQAYSMPTPGDLPPGEHILSFRLDQFGELPSTVSINTIQTGRGAFVSPGDVNVDDQVDVDDLIAVILGWGACPAPPALCPADVAPVPDGDGQVDVDDLITVILNWG